MEDKKIVFTVNKLDSHSNDSKDKDVALRKCAADIANIPIDDIEESQSNHIDELLENHRELLIKEIKLKLSSYYQQDKIKSRVSDNTGIIKPDEVIQVITDQTLKCYYCNENMKLLYKSKYDKSQWTLDRIDNKLPHTKENVVISCLKCNLQKRARNHDKFHFTKNMVIKKCD
jgi:hypothetical protein